MISLDIWREDFLTSFDDELTKEDVYCIVLSRLDDDISAGLHVCLGDAKQIFTC